MNVVSTEKKNGGIVGHSFHLFYVSNLVAYLYDSDWSVPICWGSKTLVRSIATQLGRKDLLDDPNANITISIYLPVEKAGAMKMRWQYSGMVSKMIIPSY